MLVEALLLLEAARTLLALELLFLVFSRLLFFALCLRLICILLSSRENLLLVLFALFVISQGL